MIKIKFDLVNQLYKVHKQFNRARSITDTPRRVEDKNAHNFFSHIFKLG